MSNLKKNGKVYKKGTNIQRETIWGSFVHDGQYGMAQAKNAMSEKELLKYGYKRIK